MARVWNFLLPETGNHELRVEHIGTPDQHLTLDGLELESRTGQMAFPGPEGALLRLKYEKRWILLVNERIVEEAAADGKGLRDLRNLPDGSYTIATGFDAECAMQHAVRKFRVMVDNQLQEVVVAHQECIWQVSLNGKLVDQESHSLRENQGHASFEVQAASGASIPAHLEMAWSLKDMKWSYHLTVGNTVVPACWTKVGGFINGVIPPTIESGVPTKQADSDNLAEPSNDTAATAEGDTIQSHPQEPENLPQGVSYDRDAGTFQANIKDAKANRFVFLGEFPDAEAAHKKYIEALAKYAPEKRLAPLVA